MTRRGLEAAGLGGALLAAALLFSRGLGTGANYEGVYLASADAIACGESLGEELRSAPLTTGASTG